MSGAPHPSALLTSPNGAPVAPCPGAAQAARSRKDTTVASAHPRFPALLRQRARAAARLGLLAVAAVIAAVVAVPAPATAADEEGDRVQWSIGPGESLSGEPRTTIDYTVEPGMTVTEEVLVSNLGEEPLTLDLYATDALATRDGTFTVLPAAEEPVALGAWITPAVDEVELAPGEAATVPITIDIPANAMPGDHAAGILAARTSGAANDATNVTVDQRVGTRVYIRVNGDLTPQLSVTDLSVRYGGALWPFRRGPATVDYEITNTGNVRLAGSATITLQGPFGLRVGGSEPIEIADLLPGGSVTGSLTLEPTFPPGRLSAVADVDGLNLPGTVPVTVPHERATATIWAVPWAAVGILALVVATWWWRRRRLVRALRAERARADRADRAVAAAAAASPEGASPGAAPGADSLVP
ncbi:DUF916 domain-containing protein [Pseudactinotalea sp. HY158]|nr:DUF916 domain-containing protein [Pseudactinotalea sp. HY158]